MDQSGAPEERVVETPKKKDIYAAQEYFSRSPFRSKMFLLSTMEVALIAACGIFLMYKVNVSNPCIASAILVLALGPACLWIYSLFVYREIRNLIQASGRFPPYAQLHSLHAGLASVVAIFIVPILLAIAFCAGKK